MTKKVATMSQRGFLTSVVDKANEEMLNFYLCHYNQSDMFYDKMVPLSRLLQLYGNIPSEFRSKIEMNLQMWLQRSFDDAQVEATVQQDTDSTTKILIGVMIGDGGTTYQLNHLLRTEGQRLIEVLNSAGETIAG